MSCRVDTSPLIAGACVVSAYAGLGVTGAVMRATTVTGASGPGMLYPCWDSGDDAKEFRYLIATTPGGGGVFTPNEDGSFSHTGAANGVWPWTAQLYADGPSVGSPFTITETIGSVVTATISEAGGIASGEAFGAPIVTTSTVIAVVGAGGIASGEAFGIPTVVASSTATVSDAGGIASAEAFGVPTVVTHYVPSILGRSTVRAVYGPGAFEDCCANGVARAAAVLLPKDRREIDDVPFIFAASLDADETIVSTIVTPTTYSGTDPNPEALCEAAPVIVGTDVVQRIANGLPGCAYHFLCQITTSKGRIIVAAGVMSVTDL